MSVRRKNNNKRKVRTVVALSIISLLFISTGYAAISTNITLKAKGNIIKPSSDLSTEDLTKEENVLDSSSTNDGLYKDTTEEAVNGKYRYIYKGADPDNYICLSDDEICKEESMYRIIAIETDETLKVIKNEDIGDMAWDSECGEDVDIDIDLDGISYNKPNKKENIYEIDHIIYLATSGSCSNGWVKPATLNTYLNDTWYSNSNNGLSSTAKTKIVASHVFNIGAVEDTTGQTIATDVSQEKASTWNGTVGLMNVTDYVRASTDTNCTGVNAFGLTSRSRCSGNNDWLYASKHECTMTPSTSGVWGIDGEEASYQLYRFDVGSRFHVRPVFFLSSDIKLSGSGTSSSPYRISS